MMEAIETAVRPSQWPVLLEQLLEGKLRVDSPGWPALRFLKKNLTKLEEAGLLSLEFAPPIYDHPALCRQVDELWERITHSFRQAGSNPDLQCAVRRGHLDLKTIKAELAGIANGAGLDEQAIYFRKRRQEGK